MTRHLLIPDPHAHPDHNNDRFEMLGQFIVDTKPDTVICIGDWADMPSLCTYEKGTKGFEGRRYKDDIIAAIDAQAAMFDPIMKAKKKKPRFIMLEGNHEHRITRAISSDAAQLDGVISHDDLMYEDFGWEYVRYEGATPGIIEVDGIAYAHYFTSGIMGRPISGLHPANALLVKQFMSCSQGHTHTSDFSIRTRADKKHIMGLVCGWFGDYYQDYAGTGNDLWWSGLVLKDHVVDGVYDPAWISMNQLKEAYG